MKYIQYGKDKGANLVTAGSYLGGPRFYIETTIFSNVQRTIDEAIERGKKTIYCLGVGIVTKNIDVANRLIRSLHARVLWLNCYLVGSADCPSGIGREYGPNDLENYLQVKCVITPLEESRL